MNLDMHYFGIVREKLGLRRERLELPEGASVAELLETLAGRHDIFSLGAGSLRVAVNQEYVDSKHILAYGDEVAVIPPVSGGSGGSGGTAATAMKSLYKLVEGPIEISELLGAVAGDDSGATVTFLGTTRNNNRGRRVVKLEYEAYSDMVVSEFEKIGAEAGQRWGCTAVAVVHRFGEVPVGEASVAIAVSTAHRAEALDACRFLIDRLKAVAPIWKKEYFEGGEVWIGSVADCEHQH